MKKSTTPNSTNAQPNVLAWERKATVSTPLASFTQMLRNLERAAEQPNMTEDLAELLSTANVTVEHRVVTGVKIDS